MRLGFVTLFPNLILGALSHGVVGRAVERGIVAVEASNPRDFATDPHKSVDDKPFGGGPGMLMIVSFVDQALSALCANCQGCAVVVTDPTGELFDQEMAKSLASYQDVILVCGRYEGIDERFAQRRATHRCSIGDFVLSGGEFAALAIADAIVRLVPGVLGDAESLNIDSHAGGLLGAPQFTRPESWEGIDVPVVLRSGDHGAVDRWKRTQSLRITRERRPDLFALSELEKGDADMLSS